MQACYFSRIIRTAKSHNQNKTGVLGCGNKSAYKLDNNQSLKARDGYITNLNEDWNVVGQPNNQPCDKSDILVYHDGIDYSWSDAVTNGCLSDYIFSWDSITQSYSFGVSLEPGYAYWVYAYYECMIHS